MTEARDVLVVGGGVFGLWIARALRDEGREVTLIDCAAPGHGLGGSGGASRILRAMYGNEAIYTEWAIRSLAAWRALEDRRGRRLFHPTGVLWLHRPGDAFTEASAVTLAAAGVEFERLGPEQLRERYPCLQVEPEDRALLETGAGALRADEAIRALARELAADGVAILRDRVRPIRTADGSGGRLSAVETANGERLLAETIVVAGGAWLAALCPEALARRLFVTRQEVLFFDVASEATRGLPVWADMPFYGFPPIAEHGFKVASDRHGSPVSDVDAIDRRVGPAAEAAARAFLDRRFPGLASAPIVDRRVCQYANSASGDFLVDRHPGLDNVWLAGCGSGHGFKHGPALGIHVAACVAGRDAVHPRFSLDTKTTVQSRRIQ